jgi:hypothetical protein
MGAYDNPKYFNARDYTAGAKNFTTAFTTGLKEGVARGEAKIADRKEYEKGIYEKGLKLEEELTAAVDNNLKTKEEMDTALQSFYDEALRIDAPVKKGLFGAFATAKEKRLGDIDLQKMTKSFTDAAIPVNSIYDYVYTSGMSIDLDEDKGHESYENKKAIHNAVKSGHFKTNFTYVSGEGFKTDLQIVDDNGKVLRSFTPQQAQSIMTASGQKERLAIDAINKQQLDTTEKIIANGIDNKISKKTYNKTTGYVKASDEIITGINSAYGVSAFIIGDEKTGVLDYEKLPGANKRLINQTFDNYVDLSNEMKVDQYKKRNPDTKLTDEQIGVIMNMPFEAGHDAFLTDPALKGTINKDNIKDIYNNSIQAKWDATQSWLENEMKGRSIVDKFYTKPPPTSSGIDVGDSIKIENFDAGTSEMQQQVDKTLDLSTMVLPSAEGGFGGGGGFRTLSTNDLGFTSLRRTDGSGNFVNKQIKTATLSSNGLLKIEFEQQSDVLERVVGVNAEGEEIIERQVSAPTADSEPYDVFSIKGLENLYKDIGGAKKGTDLDKRYNPYFGDNVYASINRNFINNPEYLANPQTGEPKKGGNLRQGLIAFRGGMGNILSNPEKNIKLLEQSWFQAQVQAYREELKD